MGDQSKYFKGQLLLDSGQLNGSFFERTVILICEHDKKGAFGLVLNRASGNKFGEMVSITVPETIGTQPLYLGGPVQVTALSFLHSDHFLPNATVLPNLELGHSIETLAELSNGFAPDKKFRMFAGYAGWSEGQLEEELERKAWLTHPASLELIFDSEPATLWQKILRAKGGTFRLLAEMPNNPSLN